MSASGTGLLAVDRVFVIYLVLTGILAIAGGGAIGFSLAFAHGVAGLLVFRLSKRPLPRNGALRCLRLAYPLAATPFLLYPELRFLNHVITDRLFDGMVQGWELTLFGSQLSMTFHEWLPDFTISELLHLGYMSYYILVPIALIGVFVTRGDAALHRAAFATAVAFLLSYLLFTLFPVAGPRYDFPRIEGEVADGVFFQIVHTILETGSSRGTAFPSSHIAASGVAVLAAGREDPRWLWSLIVPEIALALGTVYGRFHYGVDALGGLVLMVIIWRAAPGLSERFGPLGSAPQKRPPDRQPDRPPGYQTG
jgi:membrane-associated phospholipid phosphatase